VHGRRKTGHIARRGRPTIALKLLEGAVTVHESSHRRTVPCQRSQTRSRSRTASCPCGSVKRAV
jgi:hypothetical protein